MEINANTRTAWYVCQGANFFHPVISWHLIDMFPLYTQRVRDQISFQTRSLCLLWWHSSGGTVHFPQDTQVMELWILTGHLALWPLSGHRCVSAWGSCCPSGFCGTENELSLCLYFKNHFFGFFFTPVSILSPTTAVVVALPGWGELVFPMWPLLPLMPSDHYHLIIT